MPQQVRAVAFPVLARNYVLHGWTLGEASAPTAVQPKGGGVVGFCQGLPGRAVTTAQAQWAKLEAAKEGTFKNYLYRCAPHAWAPCRVLFVACFSML